MANPGPVAAIRQFCLECQGNSSRSVRQCADEDCPLWGWRMAAIEADSATADIIDAQTADTSAVGMAAPVA